MFAVLTGDIVDSTDLSPLDLDATLDAIGHASNAIGEWPDVSALGFARRAGDAWQIAFDAPHFALRGALYIQACVRSLDKGRTTRIAIATGRGEMPDLDPNMAHGDAFTASGRLVESLPSAIYIDHASGGAQAAAANLASHIAQSWTKAQARAMALQLPPQSGSRAETAEHLKITRQAVNQALWSAGYLSIQAALGAIEQD